MNLLNKIIIHTTESHLSKAIKEDNETYQRDKTLNILNKLSGYKVFHKFDEAEHKKLVELGKSDTLEAIKKIEIDYSVYAIYLLNEWIDNVPKRNRPMLNLSDNKIKELMASLVKDKLELKYRNKENYKKVSAIIHNSKMAAKRYFHFFDNEFKHE